uniref:Uncharacterized protein n=1 Tax=Anguilla anguilla TaxID=7936 RepID=A0A0E9VXZ6_ANGAN
MTREEESFCSRETSGATVLSRVLL